MYIVLSLKNTDGTNCFFIYDDCLTDIDTAIIKNIGDKRFNIADRLIGSCDMRLFVS